MTKEQKEAYDKAIELYPNHSGAYNHLGIALAKQMKLDEAIACYRKALELDPKNAEAYLWLGISLRQSNKDAEARAAFTKSLALAPNRVWTKQQLDKTPAK